MMNMGNLMKQFGQMQKKLTQAQEELKAQELTGYAPNKSVTVVVDGQTLKVLMTKQLKC